MNSEQQRLLLNFAADIIALAAVIWSLKRFQDLVVRISFLVCVVVLSVFACIDFQSFLSGSLGDLQRETLQSLAPTLRAAPGIIAVVMVGAKKRFIKGIDKGTGKK